MEKYVIFLNGAYPRKKDKIIKLIENRKVIAVDGGANICYKLNILPDLIIGDLDSVNKKVLEYYIKMNVDIHKSIKEKDYTDFELALSYVSGMEIREVTKRFINNTIEAEKYKSDDLDVLVLGAIGKRLDMTLSNILKFTNMNNLKLLSDLNEEITYYDFEKIKEVEFKEIKNRIFSIIPLSDLENISLSGFKYPLNNHNIKYGVSLCSNEVVENICKITCEKGKILVIIS